MEIVVRDDGQEAEVRVLADPTNHTLADVARQVHDRHPDPQVVVDGVAMSSSTTLAVAGVRRGTVIDVDRTALEHAGTEHPRTRLHQLAGFGSGTSTPLAEGTWLLGPARRPVAAHLDPGPVADPAILLHVQGQLVEVEPVTGSPATLAGHPLTRRSPWFGGELLVGENVFVRHDGDTGFEPTRGERHLSPIPVGRSIERDGALTPVTVDPAGGVGIIAEHDDALAILRAVVLQLAARAWPHDTALGIRTGRPSSWEWTKWLASVDTPRPIGAVGGARARRHVVVVDDGTAGDAPRRHPPRAAVIAAAETQEALPVPVATVIHAIGGDELEPGGAVAITSATDGSVEIRPRVAPFALSEAVALCSARRQARRDRDEAPTFETDTETRSSSAPSTPVLLLPWTVARTPNAFERRLEHRGRADATTPATSETRHTRERSAPAPRSEDTPDVLDCGSVQPGRFVVPIGRWVDRDSVATLPLSAGRRLVVIGPRRSGRSSLLATMATGVRRASERASLFVVAPRGGPLVDDADALGADLARGPADVADWCSRIERAVDPIVFVDGADRVGGPSFVRLASDDFAHATVVLTIDDEPTTTHWSAPWWARPLVIRLGDEPARGVVATRLRPRRFDLVDIGEPATERSPVAARAGMP